MSDALCGVQAPGRTNKCGLFAPHDGPHRLILEDVPQSAREKFKPWVWDSQMMWLEQGPLKVEVRRIR